MGRIKDHTEESRRASWAAAPPSVHKGETAEEDEKDHSGALQGLHPHALGQMLSLSYAVTSACFLVM